MLPPFLSATLLLLGQSAMPLQAPLPPQAPEPPPGFVDSPVATAPPDITGSASAKRGQRDPFARRIVPASYRSDAEPSRNTDLDDDVTTGTAAPPPPDADDIAAVLSPSRYLGKAAVELAQRDDGTPGQAPAVPSKTTASPQIGATGQAPTASAPAATYTYTRPVVGYAATAPTYTYGVGYGGGSVVGYTYPASYGYTTYATPTYGYGTGYTYSVNADGSTTVCGPGGCSTGYGAAYGSTGFSTARPGLFGRLFGRR